MAGTFYYLYCIRNKTAGKLSLRGIDERKVFVLPHKDIEAVVTEVEAKEFDPKKVKSRLEEDVKWTEEKIRNHQEVIEKAMRDSPVIPLKFLTLYKTKKKIEDALKKQYKEFRNLLDKLKDKAEWGLKVYVVDKEKLTEAIKKEDEEIAKMKEELALQPEGVRYFLEKKIQERVSEKLDQQLDKRTKDIFEAFSSLSVENPVINKLLPGGLADNGKEMILNVSYLIPQEKAGEFQRRVARLYDNYSPRGIWLEYTGPWPPYSFVNHGNSNKSPN